ncbi:MAG: hypothetical protein ACRBF0_11935 [Calditrichia bacterium]
MLMGIDVKRIVLISMFGLLLVGCSAQPILRMAPISEERTWVYGTAYVTSSSDSVEVRAGFVDYTADEMMFDVEIINYTSDEILVTPDRFYYRVLSSPVDETSLRSTAAIDPEERLMEIGHVEEAAIAMEKTANVIGTTLVVASVLKTVHDIVTDDDHDHHDDCDHHSHHDDDDVVIVVDSEPDGAYVNKLERLSYSRDMWTNETVRKTSLKPYNAMDGHVLFPIDKEARFIELVFPIEGAVVSMIFEQTKHKRD